MMNDRLKAWVGFNDGNCDEDTQRKNGLTLGENYTNFLKSLEEKERGE